MSYKMLLPGDQEIIGQSSEGVQQNNVPEDHNL